MGSDVTHYRAVPITTITIIITIIIINSSTMTVSSPSVQYLHIIKWESLVRMVKLEPTIPVQSRSP